MQGGEEQSVRSSPGLEPLVGYQKAQGALPGGKGEGGGEDGGEGGDGGDGGGGGGGLHVVPTSMNPALHDAQTAVASVVHAVPVAPRGGRGRRRGGRGRRRGEGEGVHAHVSHLSPPHRWCTCTRWRGKSAPCPPSRRPSRGY